MFKDNPDEPLVDIHKAWDIVEYRGQWYFYDCLGQPSSPFKTEEAAIAALDEFAHYYDGPEIE